MTDLLKEFEQDLRRERADRFWQRFGPLMLIASAAVVLATIATVLWQDHKTSQAMRETGALMAAAQRYNAQDYKEALSLLEPITKNDDSAYYGIAMLRKAQAQKAAGDENAAKETYEKLSKKEGVWAELAGLAAGAKALRLKEPMVFSDTRIEMEAWHLLQQGKKDEAAAKLQSMIEDDKLLASQRERAQEILGFLNPSSNIAKVSP